MTEARTEEGPVIQSENETKTFVCPLLSSCRIPNYGVVWGTTSPAWGGRTKLHRKRGRRLGLQIVGVFLFAALHL